MTCVSTSGTVALRQVVLLATGRNLACGVSSNHCYIKCIRPTRRSGTCADWPLLLRRLGGWASPPAQLAKLALYLNAREEGLANKPFFGSDLAPVATCRTQHSGPGVCAAIGRLVASGVLPALTQACPTSPQQQASHAHARGWPPAHPSCMQQVLSFTCACRRSFCTPAHAIMVPLGKENANGERLARSVVTRLECR